MKIFKNITNITEGFFKNTGASAIVASEMRKKFIDNLCDRNIISKYGGYVSSAATELKDFYDGKSWRVGSNDLTQQKEIGIPFSSGWNSLTFLICPETIECDPAEIPDWLVFTDQWAGELILYFKNLKNLKSLKNLKCPDSVNGLLIEDCPNIEPDDLKKFKVIGRNGLKFLPDPDKSYLAKDIFKYIRNIKGPIVFNKKKLDYTQPKTPKTPVVQSPAPEEIQNSTVDAPVKRIRLKLTPVSTPDAAPIFTVNSKNRVFDQDGNEIGRLSRDCTTVYRDVNKILFVDVKDRHLNDGTEIGLAFNKRDQIIAKLVRKNQ